MTPEQITAVQRTFAQVADDPALSERFYERLFELDPSVRPLFTTDPVEQRQKFRDELGEIVRSITDLDGFVTRALDLGSRHVDYGVRTGHYTTVGTALLGALADTLGDDFTPDVLAAWAQAYDLVAETMMRGAAQTGPGSRVRD
jgi:hemoglobin-like flavoprotein